VLEIVIGVFVIDAVVPIALATVIATVITRATGGAGPLYGQRAFALASPVELLAFVGVGVAGALAGLAFVTALHATARALARIPQPWRAALGGAAVGAILIGVPAVAGNGFEPLADVLDERLAVGAIAVLMIAKLAATAASVGSGSPGGVFTPTLLIGGGAGALVAAGLDQLGAGPLAPAGGYALVGMAAATAATTHAPLMAAVLAFELSGDYAIALPLLVATATATALARAIDKRSLYTAELPAPHRWELTLDGRRGVEDLDQRVRTPTMGTLRHAAATCSCSRRAAATTASTSTTRWPTRPTARRPATPTATARSRPRPRPRTARPRPRWSATAPRPAAPAPRSSRRWRAAA
jgi:CIC family chloride channel protein